ncbi:MAG: hypothetical protein LUD68_05950 [Rikenellaceae bacterium]|nr:hypothetical protein [Rikenellaceae bacterium]
MNRIYLYTGILLSILFTSCKDFLDTESPSQFEPEYVFNSEDDILVALSGIYSVFTNDASYNSRMIKTYTPSTDVEFWPTRATTLGAFTNYTAVASNTDV